MKGSPMAVTRAPTASPPPACAQGPAWVLSLVGGIISFLTLPSTIVDLALPEAKRRAAAPGLGGARSFIASMLPAGSKLQPGGNANEPAAVHS